MDLLILLFGKGNENSKSELKIGQTAISVIFTDYFSYEEDWKLNKSVIFKHGVNNFKDIIEKIKIRRFGYWISIFRN